MIFSQQHGCFRFFQIIIILFIYQLSLAQKPDIRFDHLTIEDGLSQSSVFTILQDSRGFLWFGTQDGLNKYDGYNFKIYTANSTIDSISLSNNWVNWIVEDQDSIIWIGCSEGGLNRFDPNTETFRHYLYEPDNPTSLGSNHVVFIYVDSHNTVWVGTVGGGLNRYDRESDSFTRFLNREDDIHSISDDHILSIHEDSNGLLWIGTDGGGVNNFDRKTEQFKVYRHNPKQVNSISNDRVFFIIEDSSGTIWIGTDGGLDAFNPEKKLFSHFLQNATNSVSLSNNQVRFLKIDNEQRLWIGTYGGGLNLYEPDSNQFYNYRHDKTDIHSLSANVVYSILQDNSGLMWIGTNNGISKFGKRKFHIYQHDPNNSATLSNNFLWSVYEDSDGKIWIGTNGGGLGCLDRKTNRIKNYHHIPGNNNSIPGDRVLSVIEDREKNLWIGTFGHGLAKYNRKKNKFTYWKEEAGRVGTLPNNNIWSLMQDQSGTIWIGTDAGLCIFDPESDRFKSLNEELKMGRHRVRSIFEDADGNIWVGTYGAGMFQYDIKQKMFANYRNDPDNPKSLSDNHVSSFWQDLKNQMWIGTSQGINLFNQKDNTFKCYTETDGLPNNVIYAILGDSVGNLWVSTNRGLSCFNPENKIFKNFNVQDGLQSNEFNSGAYCLTTTGHMFFGGVNGLNLFNPKDVQTSEFTAPVFLTTFKKFEKEVRLDRALHATNHIELNYDENHFSFEFAALDFSNPQKNKYKYMLEGFDKTWIQSDNRRFASYTNLDGGDYNFKVRGSNSDGIWNPEPTTINITIIPPFWLTWYFKIIVAIILIIALITFYKTRMNRIRRQKENLERLVKEQTEELRESYKETDDIMDNVEEGLFLLNEEMEIGKRYSRVLEEILDEKEIASQNFLTFIYKNLPKKVVDETSDYLELLLAGEHETELISDLNPLHKCKFSFAREDSVDTIEKYLDFKFRALENTKNNRQLMATVTDVTQNVMLEQKLSAAENKTKQQMEWLLSILHVDPQMLNEFMTSFEKEFASIQTLLKGKNDKISYAEMLDRIYRSMHMIKGNASLLELNLFATLAHEFEDEISLIKEKEEITGNDFVPLVLKMHQMQDTFNEVKNLFERLSKVHKQLRPKRSYENKILVNSFQNLVNNLKKELDKDIQLDDKKFNPDDIPFKYRLMTKDIIIQLIRNSAVHGIETPKERKKQKKEPTGILQLQTNVENGIYKFALRDDGSGLQLYNLRKKAIALKKWTKNEIDSWDEQKVAELIYVSGVSTSEKVNMASGRGVGMDLVKQKIDQLNGQINVTFEQNKFCEFEVSLPIDMEN